MFSKIIERLLFFTALTGNQIFQWVFSAQCTCSCSPFWRVGETIVLSSLLLFRVPVCGCVLPMNVYVYLFRN